MALSWNLENIKDFKSVCYVESKNKEGVSEFTLHPATDGLIWYCMVLDMGEITEKNLPEFWARMQISDRLQGCLKMKGDKERPITFNELRAHIGLRTNAGFFSRARFMKKVAGGLFGDFIQDAKDKLEGINDPKHVKRVDGVLVKA